MATEILFWNVSEPPDKISTLTVLDDIDSVRAKLNSLINDEETSPCELKTLEDSGVVLISYMAIWDKVILLRNVDIAEDEDDE